MPQEIKDDRLRQVILQNPVVNKIYHAYKEEYLTYEEMLVEMVIKLNESHAMLMQSYVRDLERFGTPPPIKEILTMA